MLGRDWCSFRDCPTIQTLFEILPLIASYYWRSIQNRFTLIVDHNRCLKFFNRLRYHWHRRRLSNFPVRRQRLYQLLKVHVIIVMCLLHLLHLRHFPVIIFSFVETVFTARCYTIIWDDLVLAISSLIHHVFLKVPLRLLIFRLLAKSLLSLKHSILNIVFGGFHLLLLYNGAIIVRISLNW
jgi:hypothetical protein